MPWQVPVQWEWEAEQMPCCGTPHLTFSLLFLFLLLKGSIGPEGREGPPGPQGLRVSKPCSLSDVLLTHTGFICLASIVWRPTEDSSPTSAPGACSEYWQLKTGLGSVIWFRIHFVLCLDLGLGDIASRLWLAVGLLHGDILALWNQNLVEVSHKRWWGSSILRKN